MNVDQAVVAIVLYVIGLDGPSAERAEQAVERALGAPAQLELAGARPSDATALAKVKSAKADAVVEVQGNPELTHVELRVAKADTPDQWQQRTLDLDGSYDRAAREQAIGNAAADMLRTPAVAAVPVPRFEFGAAFALSVGRPTTPGLALRGRVRVLAGGWIHVGASARGGSAPVDGGVREIPLELGLGYHFDLGSRVRLGLRAEGVLMSRRMAVPDVSPETYHRWLFAVRGGGEVHVNLHEQFGLALFLGVEANLGRTEVELSSGSAVFSPVKAYGELGPYVTF